MLDGLDPKMGYYVLTFAHVRKAKTTKYIPEIGVICIVHQILSDYGSCDDLQRKDYV